MIVFFQSGRLGNQLFQYAALRTLAREDTLVLVGFEDLQSVFEGLRASFIGTSNSRLFRACERVRPWLNRTVPKNRLFSFVQEDAAAGNCAAKVTECLLQSPKYACTGYFQCEAAFDPSIPAELRLNPALAADAETILRRIRQDGSQPVFVHIRRGDYLQFPDPRQPAVIPASWYQERISEFRTQMENPRFVFLSDDVHYLHDVFGDMRDASILDASPELSFALMTLCDGGILSASSFAWWGAYLAHRRNARAQFVAPSGWVGHRTGKWHPPRIKSTFLSYAPTTDAS